MMAAVDMFLHSSTSPDSTMDINYSTEPKLIIREQPKSKFRFRYKNEGTTHGALPGERSKKGGRTYPSVEIVNCDRDARIVVSLVTDELQPKLHAHSLVGKDCHDGICTVQVGPHDMTACFQNLMIEHATKKDSVPILQKRILDNQEICTQLGYLGATDRVTEAQAEEQARELAKDMDLSKVRLCFQGYLKDPVSGKFVDPLPQVVSNVVWNVNSPHSNTLKICRMDRSSGSTYGGEEVYLLCDRVQKDDIEVRFVECASTGELIWEGFGDFGPTDVHRQYAIVFKTPRFRERSIPKPVIVYVQLRRKSDGECSETKPFTYHPPIEDAERLKRKRFKPCVPLSTSEELLKNFIPENGSNKFIPNMTPNFAFGTPTINQKDLQCMMQCNVVEQPSTSNNQLYGPAVINQPQINSRPVNQNQPPFTQQLSPQQRSPTQLPQQQLLQQQLPQQQLPQQQLPQQQPSQMQPSLQTQQQLFGQGQQKQQLILQQRQVQQSGILQADRNGNLQTNFNMQQNMQQNVQQMNTVQPMVQQQNRTPQQTVLQQTAQQSNVQQNVFMHQNRPRASLVRRGNKKKPVVKKEPLDCSELKENLPEVKMETQDSDSYKGLGLDFPTNDIRSDATPRGLAGEIEADACSLGKANHHEYQSKMGRTKEWVEGYRDHDKFGKESASQMQCVVLEDFDHEEKVIQTEPTVDYEQEIYELGARLSTALLMYAQTGDCRILLQAQRQLCNVDDENGDTPLHLAVIHKQPEALYALLCVVVTIEGQQIINQKNKLNQTPLHLAIVMKDKEVVDSLLRCAADPNTLDHQGYNSLHLAVEESFYDGIESLLNGPPKDPVLPLVAIDKDARNLDGYTALHMAVIKGDIDACRRLINSGADSNIPDGKSGRVPLHHAVITENFTMLSYLVADAEVEIEAEDFAGNTPLHIASAYDLRAVAALLIAAGANPDKRNCDTINESDASSTDEGFEFDDDDNDERVGSSPLDYAKSDQMKRVLLGEQYVPFVPGALEVDDTSSDHSSQSAAADQSDGPRHSSRYQTDSGIQSRGTQSSGGCILSLPSDCVRSLAKALDVPSESRDWRSVARSLGMGNMVNHLRSFDSPSQVLLEQYALMDGTLLELLQTLKNLRRDDAVEMIKNAVNQLRV